MKQKTNANKEQMAVASAKNIVASYKHCVEISNFLRFRSTGFAKQYLEKVILKEQAIPFIRFYHNVGHRVGMSAGRYPVKAAQEFLHLIKSVEENAQFKGLNPAHLKIVKLVANKASSPATGGRFRTKSKRSHIDIEVQEIAFKEPKKESKKNPQGKETAAPKASEKKVKPQ